MAGKFEVYKVKAGGLRFHLKAGNGEVIATGGASAPKLPPSKESNPSKQR